MEDWSSQLQFSLWFVAFISNTEAHSLLMEFRNSWSLAHRCLTHLSLCAVLNFRGVWAFEFFQSPLWRYLNDLNAPKQEANQVNGARGGCPTPRQHHRWETLWLELEARHGSAGSTGPQLNSRLNCGLREGWTFGLGPFFLLLNGASTSQKHYYMH